MMQDTSVTGILEGMAAFNNVKVPMSLGIVFTILLLVLPGFSIARLYFSRLRSNVHTTVEWVLASIGFSTVSIIALGITLGLLWIPLNRANLGMSLVLVLATAFAIGFRTPRSRSVKQQEVATVNEPKVSRISRREILGGMLAVSFSILVILVAFRVSYATDAARFDTVHFTQFWALPVDEGLQIGVRSFEQSESLFSLRVIAKDSVVFDQTFSLPEGETMTTTLGIESVDEGETVTALLYKGGLTSSVYRRVEYTK